MIFEHFSSGGCQSYLVGCADSCAAALLDPEIALVDRYLALAARDGLRIHYLIDTHTHADHFSATQQLSRKLGVPVVMHRSSPAPFVDLRVEDRVFTGDTLLIGATGRTDLPSGDPEALHDSLFNHLLRLEPTLNVHPAHEYKGRPHTTIALELASNPRLQVRERAAFAEMMRSLNLSMPTHVTEALRTNMSGGKTVAQMLAEAAENVPFMSLAELQTRIEAGGDALIVLDVREREAYEAGHIPGARLLPRGQLELRVNQDLPDPTRRIVVCCEFGRISTLATATLRQMGFQRAVALDGGIKAWREAGYALTS